MPYNVHNDPEAGLNDTEAAELIGISVHTLRQYRAGGAPYFGPKFTKLGKRIIYKRKDAIAYRESEGIEAVMMRDKP